MTCDTENSDLEIKHLVAKELDISDLTDTNVGGIGIFDKLLTTARNSLYDAYSKGHITQKEYSDCYINTYQATLQQAVAFTLEREKLPYTIQNQDAQTRLTIAQANLTSANRRLVQSQIIDTETDTQTKVLSQDKIKQEILLGEDQLELNIWAKEKAKLEVESSKISIKQQKAQLDLTNVQIEQIKAQTILVNTQNETAQYELQYKLPKEVEILNAQIEQTVLQTKLTQVELDKKVPLEIELLANQLDTAKYQLENELPKRIELLENQINVGKYELANKLPKEVEMITAQTEKVKSDVELAKEQIEIAKVQLNQAEQELKLKVAQLALSEQQLELAKSQLKYQEQKVVSEQAQTDGSVIKEGSTMWYANTLMKAQTEAYEKDHIIKGTKLFYDVVTAGIANDVRTANTDNRLDDGSVKAVTTKLLESMKA